MKLTKRIISLLMAMLMLCSGMAISASAETSSELYTLTADNCYIDIDNIEIVVKSASVEVEGISYDVVFTATQSDDETMTLRGLKDSENNTIFTNPVAGKTYNIKGTITIDETEEAVTNVFAVEVLKAQSAPAAPVAKKITATSIEIGNVSGCEYRINGGDWGDAVIFTGLEADTAYTIEMRAKKTTTHYASPASSITVKTLNAADSSKIPDTPVLVDKTESTLTVKEAKNVEFSIDNGKTWQESGTFTGLSADSTYSIIARYTFDASVQEANPSTAPVQFITNERATYYADLNKCQFTASSGDNYANESISFTITIDVASSKYSAQYGDTKYIPSYYTIGSSTEKNAFSVSSDGKTFKASFIPGEANAEQKLAIKVYYEKQKCYGDKENGEPDWRTVGELETKTYYVQVGEVHTTLTDIRDFFLEIFNVLFNTIPAAINDMLEGFDLSTFLNNLATIFGALDLGA